MRKEGFMGQKLIVFPEYIQQHLAEAPLTKGLYITNIGYYPKAGNHLVERKEPVNQQILIYCHHGEGWCKTNGKKRPIKAGQYFIIPAATPHQYGSSQNSSWEVSWIHFDGKTAGELAEQLCDSNYATPIDGGEYTQAFELFSDIISRLERGLTFDSCTYASMRIWHYFADILHLRHLSAQKDTDAVQSAIDIMYEHVESYLNLDEVSEQVKLTPNYLCRTFKNKTGHSPIDYFIRLKIQRACQYLDLTELKVKDISLKVGYDDPYYFSRIFKKIMGCSPAQYREKSK